MARDRGDDRESGREERRGAPSPRTVGLVVLAVALAWFGIANSDEVPVTFFVGDPREVRLIYALGVAALLGIAVGYLAGRTAGRRARD